MIWTAELVHGQIIVAAQNVAVEHAVRINEFYQWIDTAVAERKKLTHGGLKKS